MSATAPGIVASAMGSVMVSSLKGSSTLATLNFSRHGISVLVFCCILTAVAFFKSTLSDGFLCLFKGILVNDRLVMIFTVILFFFAIVPFSLEGCICDGLLKKCISYVLLICKNALIVPPVHLAPLLVGTPFSFNSFAMMWVLFPARHPAKISFTTSACSGTITISPSTLA